MDGILFNFIQILLVFGIPLMLLLSGIFIGRYIEKKHFQELREREQHLGDFFISDVKSYPRGVDSSHRPEVVMSEVVVANDYLKWLLTQFKKIIGGELKSYRTLLERARREAILRIAEKAKDRGYNAICNLRIYMSNIGGTSNRNKPMAEAFVTGTAYRRREEMSDELIERRTLDTQ